MAVGAIPSSLRLDAVLMVVGRYLGAIRSLSAKSGSRLASARKAALWRHILSATYRQWVGSPRSLLEEAAVDRDLRLREIVSVTCASDWQVPRYSRRKHGSMVSGRFRQKLSFICRSRLTAVSLEATAARARESELTRVGLDRAATTEDSRGREHAMKQIAILQEVVRKNLEGC